MSPCLDDAVPEPRTTSRRAWARSPGLARAHARDGRAGDAELLRDGQQLGTSGPQAADLDHVGLGELPRAGVAGPLPAGRAHGRDGLGLEQVSRTCNNGVRDVAPTRSRCELHPGRPPVLAHTLTVGPHTWRLRAWPAKCYPRAVAIDTESGMDLPVRDCLILLASQTRDN